MSTTKPPSSQVTLRDMMIARPSLTFALELCANGIADLKPLDSLLVLAVNQANIAPLRRDPEARERYGALETPARDDERRRVSISAIATSLGLPFETVRQRLRRLAERGAIAMGPEGVFVPAAFLTSERYLLSVLYANERLRVMYGALTAEGLVGRLPAPNYDTADGIPLRAAVALVADYVLRVVDPLLREAGDTVSTLILLALLVEALTKAEHEVRPLTNRELSERLKLPVETVRRHGLQLAGRDIAVRRDGGLVLRAATLHGPAITLLLMQNPVHVKRLLDGLAERGIVAAWSGVTASDAAVA